MEGARVRLKVLDAPAMIPVTGARLALHGKASGRDRLLHAVLAERCGLSGVQGLLDLGALPSQCPQLWVIAGERRMARVPAGGMPTGEPIQIRLAAYQDLEVLWSEGSRAGEQRQPEAILSSCRSGGPCSESVAKARQPLSGKGKARFSRCAPGRYRVTLAFEGRGGTSNIVECSDDSADPAVISTAFSMREWHLRGRAKLTDGTPVKASVQGNTVVVDPRQGRGDTLFETSSSPDGSFGAAFFAPEGVRFSVDASADEPAAETIGVQSLTLTPSLEGQELVLTLFSGGVRVVVRDRQDGKPIPNCPVAVSFESGEASQQATDSDGAARFVGGKGGATRITAHCEGYSSPAETLADFSDNQMRDVEIRLDRAGAIEVIVLDAGGAAFAGAQLLVLDLSQVTSGQAGYWLEPTPVGVTGGDGRATLRGDLYGGRPLFVVAPDRALTIGWLPTGGAGGSNATSTVQLSVEPPSAFPGLAVSDASGHPLRVEWLAFSRNGIPIPRRILEFLAQANRLSSSGFIVGPASQPMSIWPAYFSSGDYSVSYVVADKETHRPRAIDLGLIHLPSAERIELRAMLAP